MRRSDQPAGARPEGILAERAAVLTISTLLLLVPPILTIVNVPILIFGIPLLHVYCFAVWLAAIACGGRLAARMTPEPSKPGDPGAKRPR